jgi:anti-sigma factor RsiW
VTPDAREELLQQYFDGELAPAQAAEVEAQLGRDTNYAARYDSLLRLRELITLSAEEISSEVDFDSLYGRIESDVQGERGAPGALERLSVLWNELWEHRRALALGVPVAVTAALVIVLWPDRGLAPSHPGPVAHTPTQPQAAEAETQEVTRYETPTRPQQALAQNSEIVQVDFGDNTGTVFEIALADGVSTPVVWINDEE